MMGKQGFNPDSLSAEFMFLTTMQYWFSVHGCIMKYLGRLQAKIWAHPSVARQQLLGVRSRKEMKDAPNGPRKH